MNLQNLKITEKSRLTRRGAKDGVTLYSAYRPLRFSELYGSAAIAGEGIKRSIIANKGKLPQAAIAFTGFSGTGKTTLSLITALALNCPNRDENYEPCLECPRCKGILNRGFEGTDPYFIVKNTAKMKQDDIINMVEQDIKSGTALINRKGGTRIVCLEEAHNLTKKSIENLLLPVENVLTSARRARVHVFLTSSEADTLFANKAWQSRILSINLSKFSGQDLFNILIDIAKQEHEINGKPKITRDVLGKIIEMSDLSLRHAITLLQGVLEQSDPDLKAITLKDTGVLLGSTKTWDKTDAFINSIINGKERDCYSFLKEAYIKHNISFETIATMVVKKLTSKGINLLAGGDPAGEQILAMARAFNSTLGNSLYQDRFTALGLATAAAFEERKR
tara:strand:- start:4707 stop:5885 length:1179 start_codon:yes stop_codon:yes gene_type:complete